MCTPRGVRSADPQRGEQTVRRTAGPFDGDGAIRGVGVVDVIATSARGTAPVWDSSGKVVATYGQGGDGAPLTGAVFSLDRTELALGSEDGTAIIYSDKGRPTTLNGQERSHERELQSERYPSRDR